MQEKPISRIDEIEINLITERQYEVENPKKQMKHRLSGESCAHAAYDGSKLEMKEKLLHPLSQKL